MKYRILHIMVLAAALLSAQIPDWTLDPHAFEYSASLTGQIQQDDSILSETGGLVSAWSGPSLVGTAAIEIFPVSGLSGFQMTVYSRTAVDSHIHFRYYSAERDSILPVLDSLEFISDARWGTHLEPLAMRVPTPDPDWQVNPHAYEFDMSVTAVLLLNGEESRDAEDAVAAFMGDALLGTARPVYYPLFDRWICSMPVYSNTASGTVHFRIYDASEQRLVEAATTIEYVINGMLGQHEEPFVISSESGPALTADFTADIQNGFAPLDVQFMDLSSGDIQTWAWDFGDGEQSAVKDPIHRYSEPGVYTVRLTVTDAEGQHQTAEKTDMITVNYSDNGAWDEPYVLLYDTDEADIMMRVGDIDNLGFGWPEGFDPFSGNSTPTHSWPFPIPDADDPAGTDTVLVPSSYSGNAVDGYASSVGSDYSRHFPEPLTLVFDPYGYSVDDAMLQLFVDDFQAPSWGTVFQATLDGIDAPFLSDLLNGLDQTGPIGKLITADIPGEFLPLIQDGILTLYIDDPVTGTGDGFAIDFVRLLVNRKTVTYTGTLQGRVVDDSGHPLEGALVTASGVSDLTDSQGFYVLAEVPAGLVRLQASREGYESAAVYVDLLEGSVVEQDLQLIKYLSLGNDGLPTRFQLHQNYPNPFNPVTAVRIDLPDAGHTTLTIYDISGRSVLNMDLGMLPAGFHRVQLDMADLPSGLYLCRLSHPGFSALRKMTLMK